MSNIVSGEILVKIASRTEYRFSGFSRKPRTDEQLTGLNRTTIGNDQDQIGIGENQV